MSAILIILVYLVLGIAAFAVAKRYPKRFGASADLPDFLLPLVLENPVWILIPLTVWVLWPFVFVAGMMMEAGTLETQLRKPGSSGLDLSRDMIGQEGEATMDLKPGGKVSVSGNTFDASCRNSFIPKGTKVKVIRRDAFSLIVEAR